jgi:hypothetical protein
MHKSIILVVGLSTLVPLAAWALSEADDLAAADAAVVVAPSAMVEEADAPMRFETPDAAVMELIDAAEDDGSGALLAVLGADLDALVSGDPVADAQDRQDFVELARAAAHIEDETDDSAILVIGPDDWPFPIPLARDAEGWYFDTEAGVEELLDRRIGLNELHAIATARAFVDAQMEYAAADPDGDGRHAYADRFLSSEGKRDGLYWPTAEGEPESPMGPLVADAVTEGYAMRAEREGPRPYHGYLFKMLNGQGVQAPAPAPDGERGSPKGAGLEGGFALLAWPASYGNSGIMSFLVNQRGIVYQADLGDDTADQAAGISDYDIGDGWEPVVD